MSSRQLRKLQKQKELEQIQALNAAGETDESDDDAPVPVSKPKANPFSGFGALDDGGDVDSDDDDAQGDEDQYDATEPTPTISQPTPPETPKSSSKKSKKKKKKKAAKKSESNEPAKASDDLDDIDKVLQELNITKDEKDKSKTTIRGHESAQFSAEQISGYERICELLRINTQKLQAIKEMYSFFGREAIASAQNEEQQEQERLARERRSRNRGTIQVDLETYLKGVPGQSLPEVTLRRNPFLPGKETWPKAAVEGLTMRQIDDGTIVWKDSLARHAGASEFAFTHSAVYDSLEMQFFQRVQMYEPMHLIHFLHDHPYHVSSLIQVGKVAKQQGDLSLCGDLCERALFTFGRVSISAFRQKLEQGKARLEFYRPENRQFWLAGYHYLKSLVVKGTYRTALEWAKLIFSMDLKDPYGVMHFIHPLAIRAYESKWFIDFCDSEALDECDVDQDYIRQTLVLARLQQKDEAGAKTLLMEGMEKLPWLYSSIFQSLNLDVPKSLWGMQARNSHEELWVTIYVNQTKGLWDNLQATSLLKEAAAQIQKPDASTFATTPVVLENLARFVYLDNTPALMGQVPSGMLNVQPNYDFDPLPPSYDDNIFSTETQMAPWQTSHAPSARMVQLPNNRGELVRLLDLVREQGAPENMIEVIEQAIQRHDENGGQEDAGDEGDAGATGTDTNTSGNGTEEPNDIPENVASNGLIAGLMNMLWPGGTEANANSNGGQMQYMPGMWVDDEEEDEDGTGGDSDEQRH